MRQDGNKNGEVRGAAVLIDQATLQTRKSAGQIAGTLGRIYIRNCAEH